MTVSTCTQAGGSGGLRVLDSSEATGCWEGAATTGESNPNLLCLSPQSSCEHSRHRRQHSASPAWPQFPWPPTLAPLLPLHTPPLAVSHPALHSMRLWSLALHHPWTHQIIRTAQINNTEGPCCSKRHPLAGTQGPGRWTMNQADPHF